VVSPVEACDRLRLFVESRNFSGYDPYDALNSPILSASCLGEKWARIAAIQIMKRSPFNVRPFLRTRAGQNPKGLALFLGGYVRLPRTASATFVISQLLELLSASRASNCSGHAWGYNFDWQSRAFFVPRGTPSIVCSAFVGHALLDTWHATANQRALDLAVPIAGFLLNDLNRTRDRGVFCFSYTPLDKYAVHNANLLGASLLIRLYAITGDERLRTAALESLAYSMKYQREDGAWFYSERPGSQWIDSYHTGFNLESLRHFLQAGSGTECGPAYSRGVTFYAERFFLPDGTPKHYCDRTYPIDIHSAAEAVIFFSSEPGYGALATRVLDWTLDVMYDERGYFYFQKDRLFTNRICYMRWSQAWMFRALTEFIHRGSLLPRRELALTKFGMVATGTSRLSASNLAVSRDR
jgi:hypothetical protein